MRLYLVRHGDALSHQVDIERSLSDLGRSEVEAVAQFLQASGVTCAAVQHSELLRAKETAEILAARLLPKGVPEMAPGLRPSDDVEPWETTLAAWEGDLMLVGHLPFMGDLISLLISGDPARASVMFQTGTAACLLRMPDRRWTLSWMVSPQLLGIR